LAEHFLEFEKPITELEQKLRELRTAASAGNLDAREEIAQLEAKVEQLKRDIFSRLTRWQRVLLARHPQRPYALDYIAAMAEEWCELHGDRLFRDDPALIGGLAKIGDKRMVIVGHQKGRDTKERVRRNFGQAHPEGYRKACRLFQMAVRFDLPILSLVDTQGAFPGDKAEERGIAEAIARSQFVMARLPVPIVVVVIGEGGSGGAIGIGVGDKVMMLEHAYYSVISPEGCASILWRDATQAPQAAEALRLTASDCLELGVVDRVIPEPLGGAHRNLPAMVEVLRGEVLASFEGLGKIPPDVLVMQRSEKFGRMGCYAAAPS
jgi:acetyl-CoA carboxylase carboxyl transferase subunit alpha